MKKIDLAGKRFGRLAVLERAPSATKDIRYLCLCDCGESVVTTGNNLRRGKSKSCGCWRKIAPTLFNTTHGMKDTPEYRVWTSLKTRCTNPAAKSYPDYGGRGISVSPEWEKDFKAFFDHVGPRPSRNHSIDRIDNDGNYEVGNVQWATREEQRRNRRDANKLNQFSINGVRPTAFSSKPPSQIVRWEKAADRDEWFGFTETQSLQIAERP